MSSTEPKAVSQSLFRNYVPPSGTYDEAVDAGNTPRPHWSKLVDHLERLGEAELRKRWQQGQSQIERDGVTFNPYDEKGLVSRPWILDAIPMVLQESEWQAVTSGLVQRATVLEAMLHDLFGPQTLLKDRVIPPELLFGHPAWYPSYQGLARPDHRYLTYSVTDLAHAPDGQWWVTGDRTRSPFGLGYVLENRIVTSRMLSGIFRELQISRLAGFYATLKETLRRMAPRFRDNPRIVLWTKGPQSRGYFEDSYLARYLGYTLAEGDDLAVRDRRVQLLTLGGLLPVEVLLRRIDDDDCDSVELKGTSQVGVSALLEVIREDRVAVANAVGSRLVESPAFLPFLNAASQHLFGEDLRMPSVATWWCGDKSARSHVIANLDRMLVRPAFRMADVAPVVGQNLSRQERQELIDRINTRPSDFVCQEAVMRSTTPVLTDDGVVPWYVGLRSFLVATDDGFQSLPGGLARVSPDSGSLNFTMTAGERSQDVWILSDEAVDPVTLLEPASTLLEPRRSGAELPSRVADNLFWLGRYTERAEQTARLLHTLLTRLESEEADGTENQPLLQVLVNQRQIGSQVLSAKNASTDVFQTLLKATVNSEKAMSLKSSVQNAVRTAMRVRDRISMDMWRAIDRLNSQFLISSQVVDLQTMDMLSLLEQTLADLASFAGLVDEGMTRTLGWRFLDLGRRLERSWQTAALLRSFFCHHRSDNPETLETLLTVTGSLMTYRNRYLSTFQIPVVLDLLLTDTTNPRSVIYQLLRINEQLEAMPGAEGRAIPAAEQKLAMSMANSVRLADVYDLSTVDATGTRPILQRLLARLDEKIPKLSDAVSGRYLIHAGLPRHFGAAPTGLDASSME